MRLSILTGALDTGLDQKSLRDPKLVLRTLREIGYEAVDLSFTAINEPAYILRGEDWRQRIDELGNTAAALGITLCQCHLPFPKECIFNKDPNFKKPGFREYFEEMFRRAYEASGILGIPYATVHPLTQQLNGCADVQLAYNHEFYDPLVEWGVKCGVGTAFENMRPDSPHWSMIRRYGQDCRDLITLADSFHDPMVGICWDTGHANQAQCDQVAALHAIGHRLKNLHINDNYFGAVDEHLLPFMGQINWESILKALVQIDYQGALNYEVGRVTKRAPWELQKIMMHYVYQNGCQLLEMYEKFKAANENDKEAL